MKSLEVWVSVCNGYIAGTGLEAGEIVSARPVITYSCRSSWVLDSFRYSFTQGECFGDRGNVHLLSFVCDSYDLTKFHCLPKQTLPWRCRRECAVLRIIVEHDLQNLPF